MTYKPVDTAITMVVGPCIDDTDFKSLEEAIAYNAAGMDVSLIVEKTDGTTAVTAITLTTAGTSDWTHKDGGYYEIEVTAAQNVEEGVGYIRGVATGILPFESAHYNIVKANVYDSLIKGTDVLQADVTQLGGVAQSLTDLKDFADAGYDPATNKIEGVKLADTTTTNTDMRGTDSAATATNLATVDTVVDTILVDTNELQTDWVNGGRLDLIVDAILADVTGIAGDAMRGTDSAATATNLATVDTVVDGIQTDLSNATDGLGALKALIDTVDTVVDAILADTGTDGVVVASGSKTGYALAATGANLILKNSTFALALADAVWDEILTGATHNITTSAGRRLREIGAYAVESGTAQAGSSHTITLAATASAVDGTYNRNLIVITDNTGVGQTRTIVDYNGTTKVAIIDRDWRTSPDATTNYQITPDNTPLVVDQGVAQAGTATTITLRVYASSTNDTYLCNVVAIIAGTGRGQARLVGSYNGTTKVVTICGDNWIITPDATSVYVLMPYGTTCTSCVGNAALTQIRTEIEGAGYKLATIEADTDELQGNQADWATATSVTISDKTGFALSAAGIDAILDEVVEGTLTMRQILRIDLAVLAGIASGGGTNTSHHRDVADSKDRVLATVDIDGNRTAVTLDGT